MSHCLKCHRQQNVLQHFYLLEILVRDHSYRQLVSCSTTDNRTTIDHVYTNLPESQIHVHILGTYFSDNN